MEHTIFLEQRKIRYEEELNRLRERIGVLETRLSVVDELLRVDDEADDEMLPRHDNVRSRFTVRDVVLLMLQDEPNHELSLDEMIIKASMKGHEIERSTLQSTLSRNKTDFEAVMGSRGTWTLTDKHLPWKSPTPFEGLTREQDYMRSLPSPFPPIEVNDAEGNPSFPAGRMTISEVPEDSSQVTVSVGRSFRSFLSP